MTYQQNDDVKSVKKKQAKTTSYFSEDTFIHLSPNSSTVLCPVCESTQVLTAFPHNDFKGYCIYICGNSSCYHGWTDYQNPFVSDSHYNTNTERADRYCDYIEKYHKNINSLLEIGSANDFYFLKKLHSIQPNIKLYLYDNVDYSSQVPKFVTFINNLNAISKVDLAYSCHSLEHIIDLNHFFSTMHSKCTTFITEVPRNPPDKWNYVRRGKWGTGFHYHFFNGNSLTYIARKHNFTIMRAIDAPPPDLPIPYEPKTNLFLDLRVA